jgi:glutaredoxin-dependent peroxiredoxin
MAIVVGQTAPDFSLFASDKRLWTLSDHRGRPLVLLFFPAAFSGVCTREVNMVNNSIPEYSALRASIVGISTDTPYVLAEYKKVNRLAFPLLSDHDADVALLYGAKYEGDFEGMRLSRVAKRSAFVVDAKGTVRYAEVLDDADQQPNLEAVIETLRQLA